MSSFEEQFVLRNPTRRKALQRDLALLRNSARFLWLWLTRGRAVRRLLREAERCGQVVYLDDLFRPGP
jgi:hypothetical protein